MTGAPEPGVSGGDAEGSRDGAKGGDGDLEKGFSSVTVLEEEDDGDEENAKAEDGSHDNEEEGENFP